MSNKNIQIIEQLSDKHRQIKQEIAKVIIGQDQIVDNILLSIYSSGHTLLIGVPGLAKTLIVNTISRVLDLDFNRIQFTPDLMPSDIIGNEILDENRKLEFVKGPIFANIVLADEINRTPPKTQSALLEAMQEHEVTVSGHTYNFSEPFFVLATQNPIEQEGTYPLPEAQLDRFMFALELDYPSFEEEALMVKRTTDDHSPELKTMCSAQEILTIQQSIRQIAVADNVIEYAVSIVHKTRVNNPSATAITKEYIDWGAGPRASQTLIMAAKTHAAINGKFSPDKEDVKAVAHNILRHRIIKNYKAESEGITINDIIDAIL